MELDISETISPSLRGKVVVLGVTGSIAAVRVVDLCRDLIRRGAEVRCVMSAAARLILHPYALEYASGHPVITEITGQVEHVQLCGLEGRADLLLVAPATANTLGKMAHGIDDTPVTTFATTALGSGKPVMAVPAMHEAMYRHPGVVANLERLQEMGVVLVDPRMEEGKAKIADNGRIVLEVERLLSPQDLAGQRILITGGATAEAVDPIRILTNRASGRTGVEVALEAYRRGAEVTLVHRNPQPLPFPQIVAESAGDMLRAVLEELETARDQSYPYHAFIGAAAVADYTLDPAQEKIKSGGELVLRFRPTTKIISSVRSLFPDLCLMGFKAETHVSPDELITRAQESMDRSGLDLVVANDVGRGGMGTEENSVVVLDRGGVRARISGSKVLIARALVEELVHLLNYRAEKKDHPGGGL